MKSTKSYVRLLFASVLAIAASLPFGRQAVTQSDPSWNDGAARKAVVEFVRATTDKTGPNFVQHEERLEAYFRFRKIGR